MKKVITYGTYDLLHEGHIRLLKRAKELGDYLIVGITSEDFDKARGKINVQQSLIERIDAIKKTGLADEIIVEEYEGQKIDDIKKNNVDIFVIGSDWYGVFDYLNEYCKVIYLDRTKGISSTQIRHHNESIKLGIVGDSLFLNKFVSECQCVNGVNLVGICTESIEIMSDDIKNLEIITNDYDCLLKSVDAVFIRSQPKEHYDQIKKALNMEKHVLCDSPLALSEYQCKELFDLAKAKDLVLMDFIKTAYATAYARLLLLVKGGKIGKVTSVDATCTSLNNINVDDPLDVKRNWTSIYEWGPTSLLPVFQILGTDYLDASMIVRFKDDENRYDTYNKVSFLYEDSVATIQVGNGVKSEGDMVVAGTKGYIYVPAPWWKTDYFEVRYEDVSKNQRYFYQLDGEGIRNEIVLFVRSISSKEYLSNIDINVSLKICKLMDIFNDKEYKIIK